MINGIVVVNKERSFTSHDVVAVLRGMMGEKKIGHMGTLDPDATGVLVVCLGRATKMSTLYENDDKEYRVSLEYGSETDTQDQSGRVTRQNLSYQYDEEAARRAALSFIGSYEQLPPMYSAVKVDGMKLYSLAREGIEVDRKPRTVSIYDLKIVKADPKGMTLEVRCSKGTYIRALCEDIGRRLGYLAHVTELCRTRSGPFTLADARTLDELQVLKDAGLKTEAILPPDELLRDFARLTVPSEDEMYLKNGNPLTYPVSMLSRPVSKGDYVRFYKEDGIIGALYECTKADDPKAYEFKNKVMLMERELRLCVCIGNFDGVHKGHQALISATKRMAKDKTLSPCLITFSPHPDFVLGRPLKRLYSEEENEAIIRSMGMNNIVTLPFDEKLSKMSAEDFIVHELKEKLNVKAVVVGENFRFGKDGSATAEDLKKILEENDMWAEVVPLQRFKDEIISSTSVRRALEEKKFWKVKKFLGRDYPEDGLFFD